MYEDQEVSGYNSDNRKGDDEYFGKDSFSSGNGDGTGDPIVGYSDYGGGYEEEDGTLKKGYVKYVKGNYFDGHVNPSDERTIRDNDHSRKVYELHEKTQELLGNLGINKA